MSILPIEKTVSEDFVYFKLYTVISVAFLLLILLSIQFFIKYTTQSSLLDPVSWADVTKICDNFHFWALNLTQAESVHPTVSAPGQSQSTGSDYMTELESSLPDPVL